MLVALQGVALQRPLDSGTALQQALPAFCDPLRGRPLPLHGAVDGQVHPASKVRREGLTLPIRQVLQRRLVLCVVELPQSLKGLGQLEAVLLGEDLVQLRVAAERAFGLPAIWLDSRQLAQTCRRPTAGRAPRAATVQVGRLARDSAAKSLARERRGSGRRDRRRQRPRGLVDGRRLLAAQPPFLRVGLRLRRLPALLVPVLRVDLGHLDVFLFRIQGLERHADLVVQRVAEVHLADVDRVDVQLTLLALALVFDVRLVGKDAQLLAVPQARRLLFLALALGLLRLRRRHFRVFLLGLQPRLDLR